MEKWLTLREACLLVGKSATVVKRWAAEGEVVGEKRPNPRGGDMWYIRLDTLPGQQESATMKKARVDTETPVAVAGDGADAETPAARPALVVGSAAVAAGPDPLVEVGRRASDTAVLDAVAGLTTLLREVQAQVCALEQRLDRQSEVLTRQADALNALQAKAAAGKEKKGKKKEKQRAAE